MTEIHFHQIQKHSVFMEYSLDAHLIIIYEIKLHRKKIIKKKYTAIEMKTRLERCGSCCRDEWHCKGHMKTVRSHMRQRTNSMRLDRKLANKRATAILECIATKKFSSPHSSSGMKIEQWKDDRHKNDEKHILLCAKCIRCQPWSTATPATAQPKHAQKK